MSAAPTTTTSSSSSSSSALPDSYTNDPRIKQYDILKTVGEGSFGKVKLAVHKGTRQQVALKIISRKNLTSRDMAGRVEREIAYLTLLRHPHIIKLYTVITTKEEIIMVIEYAGGELFDFLVHNGKMGEDSARRFFQQIICAVEYCHRHKIVHRDLKPENLLLDSNLNVKIADFGLSNIMKDGSFLKTSCGSPNYAAPEVIGGKLYAGPEVDVWSCGVILFVLVCGKLPFDDEYIPNLFKKISQGKYSMPTFLSTECKDLISRMLVVNPLQRITIEEIRKHEWFKKNLPEYLEPPKEEFFDTGVDFSKLPNLKEIERGPAVRLKGAPHEAIVRKLGHIMKYREDDVQDALTKEEPSAIKDAYMIVRENQLMIPRLSNLPNEGFVAQSPPAWDSYLASSPKKGPGSPIVGGRSSRCSSPLALGPQREGLGITSEAEDLATHPHLHTTSSPSSNIRILPTSTPAYHKSLMTDAPAPASPSPPSTGEAQMKPRPQGTQGISQRLASPLTIVQAHAGAGVRRPRTTKWQFGIRSRNSPLEAVSCIYRALQKLGAEWIAGDPDADPTSPSSSSSGNSDAGSDEEDECEDGEDQEDDGNVAYEDDDCDEDEAGYRRRHGRRRRNGRRSSTTSVPADPWVIHCRWKKLAPPATSPPGTPAVPVTPPRDGHSENESVYVHMTIQLYQLEHDNYLVDFKCAGYERIPPEKPQPPREETLPEEPPATVEVAEDSKGRKKVGFQDQLGGDEDGKRVKDFAGAEKNGRKTEEMKEVTSPFPFLDLAGRLIIQLANTDAAGS